MFTHAILFLVSLLFRALVDPFDPYSPFKFYNSSLSIFIGHKEYCNDHLGAYI